MANGKMVVTIKPSKELIDLIKGFEKKLKKCSGKCLDCEFVPSDSIDGPPRKPKGR